MDIKEVIKYFEKYCEYGNDQYIKSLILLLDTAKSSLKPDGIDRMKAHKEAINLINKTDAELLEEEIKKGTDKAKILSNPNYLKYEEAKSALIALIQQAIAEQLIVPDLHGMQLHMFAKFGDISILRVPGGWLYMKKNSSVFVPYSDEFKL